VINNASLRQTLALGTVLLSMAWATPARATERNLPGLSDEAAVTDAMAVAGQRADLSVMRVSGQSMLPYFDDQAVIVMKKIDAARVRVGMIAVYVNRFGEKVAHRVIAPINGGWQVKGYNNDRPDSTVVNSSNLLGVVYATFTSADRSPARTIAASQTRLETVYAAPAK
jgi:signal peptidase I